MTPCVRVIIMGLGLPAEAPITVGARPPVPGLSVALLRTVETASSPIPLKAPRELAYLERRSSSTERHPLLHGRPACSA